MAPDPLRRATCRFRIDFAFAPGAAIPLWIALRDIFETADER
jgi:hypothetical protein